MTGYERRLAVVSLSGHMINNFVKSGGTRLMKIEGIPKDAVHITTTFDHASQCAYAVYAHESFDVVPDGMVPYPINPVITVFDTWKLVDKMVEELKVYFGWQSLSASEKDEIKRKWIKILEGEDEPK